MSTALAEAPADAAPFHFLTLDDLGPGGLRSLLDLTGRLKRVPDAFRNRLAGGRIGMIFDKPSTRTRVSFESAAWMLGMLPIVLRPDELQLGRGETIADTARALSLYLDGLRVRTFAQRSVEDLAEASLDPEDPAFAAPSKPVGPMYDEATGRALAAEHAWTIARDGAGWRRVVASPTPLEIVEADSVRALVARASSSLGPAVAASPSAGLPTAVTPAWRRSSTRIWPPSCSPRRSRPTLCSS